jgi:hypothetical protein
MVDRDPVYPPPEFFEDDEESIDPALIRKVCRHFLRSRAKHDRTNQVKVRRKLRNRAEKLKTKLYSAMQEALALNPENKMEAIKDACMKVVHEDPILNPFYKLENE